MHSNIFYSFDEKQLWSWMGVGMKYSEDSHYTRMCVVRISCCWKIDNFPPYCICGGGLMENFRYAPALVK